MKKQDLHIKLDQGLRDKLGDFSKQKHDGQYQTLLNDIVRVFVKDKTIRNCIMRKINEIRIADQNR